MSAESWGQKESPNSNAQLRGRCEVRWELEHLAFTLVVKPALSTLSIWVSSCAVPSLQLGDSMNGSREHRIGNSTSDCEKREASSISIPDCTLLIGHVRLSRLSQSSISSTEDGAMLL